MTKKIAVDLRVTIEYQCEENGVDVENALALHLRDTVWDALLETEWETLVTDGTYEVV